MTNLDSIVPYYEEALDMILDYETGEMSADFQQVATSAQLLYGLIHQRFIITKQGLNMMADKYRQGVFGICPRVYCGQSTVVPCGKNDVYGKDAVKLYCRQCHDLYHPKGVICIF